MLKKQIYAVILMHVAAFALLLLKTLDDGSPDAQILIIGAASLILLLLTPFLMKKIYPGAYTLMFNCMLFLLDIGFIMICRLDRSLALRQLVFCSTGFLVMFIMPLFLKFFPELEKAKYFYLVFGLGLLCATFVIGIEEFGSKNWISIAGVSFQPSELVKLAFVLYLASALRGQLDSGTTVDGGKVSNMTNSLIQCAIAAVFVGILALQNDFGGSLVFFMTFMVILYTATGNLLLVSLGLGGASIFVFILFKIGAQAISHIDTRVIAWLDPWSDPADKGYQITQSLFAIGTWGPLGSGLCRGMPERVPVVARDFIFAAISEEFGSVFAVLLIMVYIMFIYGGFHIASKCRKPFHLLVVTGLTGMLAFQVFIIIGGVTKLIPLTGITLPFISYGGSSVFICVIMAGLIQWIYRESVWFEREFGRNHEEVTDNDSDVNIPYPKS